MIRIPNTTASFVMRGTGAETSSMAAFSKDVALDYLSAASNGKQS